MTNLQIGAQMYSLRNHCQDENEMLLTLKALKAMGYNICQLSGYNRAIPAEKLREMLDESGMTCVCTHISFDEMEEDLDKVIAYHKTLGCDYPGIGGLPGIYRDSPEGFKTFAEKAAPIAKKLADNGMRFIYHNHAFELTRFEKDGRNGLEILFDSTPEEFQFELDLFWLQMGGVYPPEWIAKVAGRMDIVHFKEMNGSMKNVGVISPIGKGNMNWTVMMQACDNIGVKYALIEQDNAVEQGALDCMLFSLQTLKKLGGRF